MSKFLNLFAPAIGGTALALGAAYGISSRDYGNDQIEALSSRITQIEAHASAEADRAEALQQQIAEIEASPRTGPMSQPAPVVEAGYGLGRPAHEAEIAAWDVDVTPDGGGLPQGSGDALTGEEVFAEKCASCHGDFAEGVDNWPVLAGGFDSLADKDPVKTVGSYWPYLSTVWDYVHRSMPFGAAQTLEPDEVYAIVAYILYSNDLVDEDFELSHENFKDFEMYNTGGFVVDNRPDTEYALWRAEPCMQDCKQSVEVTMRASVLDVTPDEEAAPVAEATAPAQTNDVVAAATTPEPETALDPELVAAGAKVFKKCQACHQVGEGAKNKTGPQLNGVFGRAIGGVQGFGYSGALQAANSEGRVWDEEAMAAFLRKPRDYFKGTKMSFAGLRKDADIAAIIAYLQAQGQ